MTHHLLKTWPEYFWDVAAGVKTFEIREDDRDFVVGDVLHLAEYNKQAEFYTGPVVTARITYILRGPAFGLMQGHCVMGLFVDPDQAICREAGEHLADQIF